MNFDFLKSLNWHSIQRLADPQAANDLNDFLEKLPQNAGNNALIAAGIAWVMAAAIGLYATIQVQNLTTLRAELKETEALKPIVPSIKQKSVRADEIKRFAEKLQDIYPDLEIKPGGSSIQITANTTAQFAQFREALGHVQVGGQAWRVDVDRLCVGRECDKSKLAALVKVSEVDVSEN